MHSSEPPVWSGGGFDRLVRNGRGWLCPTEAYWRLWLQRPEMALVEESCPAEMALHAALQHSPSRAVSADELAVLADEDARVNYRVFLDFRDAVLAAGSLEAAYAGFFRSGAVACPPLFLDLLTQAIVCNVLDEVDDPWQWRAAELLFRRQRVSVQDGRVLAGDSEVLDLMHETAGMGEVGRLLVQGGARLQAVQMQVMGDGNGAEYLASRLGSGRFNFLLDLTHEVQNELPHGLTLTMNRSVSGLKALATVLEKWVWHFLGAVVRIEPQARVEDPGWRWHLGLDAEASQLLNDLYEGRDVAVDRQKRLISLFRLRFDHPQDMRSDVQGKPVYLGLAMTEQGLLKLKPQNLLLNLPLAQPV